MKTLHLKYISISLYKRAAITLSHLLLAFLLVSLLATPTTAFADSTSTTSQIDFSSLDEYINAQIEKQGLRGVSLAITEDQEIIYLKGYGSAGNNRPMTPQTPMYIGSQSKSFTGLAIAQLFEQGKINLNAPVQTYIPWFKVSDPEASKKITVNHLLHHTSGLSESGFGVILPENASNEDAVHALAKAKLTAPIGTKHQYFNIGYDILAVIVQNITGTSYDQYLQQNILDPLEMSSTTTDPETARVNGLSQGYSRLFGFTIPQRQPHRIFEVSAGYIISTAEDLARYSIAMVNNGEGVLTKGTAKLFERVQGYGMGWFISDGHIFHGGANETFKTYVDLYPREKIGIVLLINQGYMLDHYISAEQMFKGVEAIVLGQPVPAVSQGWSVKVLGWILLALTIALAVFQTRNLLSLRTWKKRAVSWSPRKRFVDIALNFLIPTIIMIIVISQIKAYFGYRFNLTYQILFMYRTLLDITLLFILGTVPDYIQGIVKLYWIVTGQVSRILEIDQERLETTRQSEFEPSASQQ